MSRNKTKRNSIKKVRRLSVPELQKLIRVAKPEISRLSSLVAFAEREIAKRGEHNEHDTDVAGPAGP